MILIKTGKIRFILAVCILFALSACDPGYAVVVNNQSSFSHSITVMVNDRKKLYSTDSVFVRYRDMGMKVPIVKDTNNSSFHFFLNKESEAIIHQGIGKPDMKETIIIDKADTIDLQNPDNRIVITKKSLSTSVQIYLR